jgi:hypothetical protein
VKHTQEQTRETLMRLSMCARKECALCKYKDRPKVDFLLKKNERSIRNEIPPYIYRFP